MPKDERGSLVIVHEDTGGVVFRYKMFIKRKCAGFEQCFEQWGGQGSVCRPHQDSYNAIFGPDVHLDSQEERTTERGIFGLSHEDLLSSEWLESDALTVKVELQVRELHVDLYETDKPIPKDEVQEVEVPPATLGSDLVSMLESSNFSDITFLVEDETIRAHAAVLCARSEVFEKLLSGSMKESVSREVVITDCSAAAFKALLKFLYGDDFACMEEMLRSAGRDMEVLPHPDEISTGSSEGSGETADKQVSLLQDVLAVSHKYQVSRLRLWCENQLCKRISVKEVCSVLCQAHLYEAKKLEGACLKFIKDNFANVVVTPGFATLGKEWPQVMIKLNMYVAGVAESIVTAPAIQDQPAQQSTGCKRKHGE